MKCKYINEPLRRTVALASAASSVFNECNEYLSTWTRRRLQDPLQALCLTLLKRFLAWLLLSRMEMIIAVCKKLFLVRD